ncbi:hypothetical protein LA080_007978 [Diaporthe eres]|nr:hypothetical protein LA080_007978 [Diaporthe eres]
MWTNDHTMQSGRLGPRPWLEQVLRSIVGQRSGSGVEADDIAAIVGRELGFGCWRNNKSSKALSHRHAVDVIGQQTSPNRLEQGNILWMLDWHLALVPVASIYRPAQLRTTRSLDDCVAAEPARPATVLLGIHPAIVGRMEVGTFDRITDAQHSGLVMGSYPCPCVHDCTQARRPTRVSGLLGGRSRIQNNTVGGGAHICRWREDKLKDEK